MPDTSNRPLIGQGAGVPQAPATLNPDMQVFQNRLLSAASDAIVTQWERLSSWVVAGFAAALALIMSNYAQVIEMTSPGTVKAILRMFVAVTVLHIIQRLLATMVQAGAASGKEAGTVKAPEMSQEQARLMLDGMAGAMWWPIRPLVRASYRRMIAGDITHVGTYITYMAQGSMVAALLQMLLGVWAVVRLWGALHI